MHRNVPEELEKGGEVLGDRQLAEMFLEEERLALAQIKQKKLKVFQEAVDTSLVLLLDAEARSQSVGNKPTPAELQRLKEEYEAAQRRFEFEEKELNRKTNTHFQLLSGPLGKNRDEKKEVRIAKPIKVFSPLEVKQINGHYAKLPEDLKKLMDAAMGEDIRLELAANPVYIRTECMGPKGMARIYEKNDLLDMLKATGESACPFDQDKKFKEADLIPCNSVLIAMDHLLHIIDGQQAINYVLGSKLIVPKEFKSDEKERRISAEDLEKIKFAYSLLPPRHQLLFDVICRDPVSRAIIEEPVLLPDGYIYDRSTVKAYLKFKDSGTAGCPSNPNIRFTEADVFRCQTVENVLKQLIENIKAAAEKAVAKKDGAKVKVARMKP